MDTIIAPVITEAATFLEMFPLFILNDPLFPVTDAGALNSP